jgi:hypothetical protein
MECMVVMAVARGLIVSLFKADYYGQEVDVLHIFKWEGVWYAVVRSGILGVVPIGELN